MSLGTGVEVLVRLFGGGGYNIWVEFAREREK
jgi:hypothetical protein